VEKIGLPVRENIGYNGTDRVRRVASRRDLRLSLGAFPADKGIMRFHANYVSTSVSGDDYYQAMFTAEEDTDDPDSPYLLIQRQFEMPDDGTCYIETHDEKYVGHFLVRRVEFTPERLSIEFDRPSDNLVSVTFNIAVPYFEEASQVVKIISGRSNLDDTCAYQAALIWDVRVNFADSMMSVSGPLTIR
jgi:hypothetical protein